MKKVLHIRGSKNYIQIKNNLLYNNLEPPTNSSTLSKNKYFQKEEKDCFFGLKDVFLLWDSCLNINYFLFRDLLRKICINEIVKINYFDTILYNDEEYINYIKLREDNVVVFSQDDDDIMLPCIHDLNINPGLNIYLWNRIDLEQKAENITLLDQKNKRIKSSHYCNYYTESGNNIPMHGLVDHQFVTKWANKKTIQPTYWDTFFNLYIRHPSSLTFLNNNILKYFYKDISLTEKKKLFLFHIKRCICIIKKIKEENKNISVLSDIYELYDNLL